MRASCWWSIWEAQAVACLGFGKGATAHNGGSPSGLPSRAPGQGAMELKQCFWSFGRLIEAAKNLPTFIIGNAENHGYVCYMAKGIPSCPLNRPVTRSRKCIWAKRQSRWLKLAPHCAWNSLASLCSVSLILMSKKISGRMHVLVDRRYPVFQNLCKVLFTQNYFFFIFWKYLGACPGPPYGLDATAQTCFK